MKTATMTRTLGTFVSVLLICGVASATTVTDNFDSYTDGDLNGQGSAGGGWDGAWYQDGTNDSLVVDSGSGLIGGSGTNKTRKSRRDLATAIPLTVGSPTVWFSFDMKITYGGGSLGYSYDTGELLGYCSLGRHGKSGSAGNANYSIRDQVNDPYYTYSSTAVPGDQWLTIVLKLETTATDGVTDYTFWVNPNLSLTEDDPNQVAPILSGTVGALSTSITGVKMNGRYYETGNSDQFDNVRLSNDSSPFVPEPTTIGLLAVGGLALLRRRSR